MFQRYIVAAAAAVFAFCAGAARAAPPPIEAFGKLPQAEAFELSPSGKRVAFVSAYAEGRAVFIMEGDKLLVRLKMSDKSDKGATEDAKIRRIDWADEDHILVWTSKTYNLGMDYGFKHEIAQVLILDLKTKRSFYIFEKDAKIMPGVFGGFGYVHKDGRVYGLFEGQPLDDTGQPANSFGEVYMVNLETAHASRVAYDSENPREWLFGPDGAVLANAEYDKVKGDWRLYAGAHHDALLAQSNNKFDSDAIEGHGRTPATILYLTHNAEGDGEIFEAPLAGGGKPAQLFNDLEQASPLFDRDNDLLIGALSGGDHPDAQFFDLHQEAVWKGVKKAFPGLNVSLVSVSQDFNTLFVYTDGDGDSGTYWTVDITTGKAEPFGSAYPDIKSDDVGPRKYVTYKAADGLELEGVLTLPPGREAKNLPVVVLPHGGPRANDDLSFDWWAEAFASRGYAVFQPNFRGSTGYGTEMLQAGYGEWGRKMQSDVSDGLAYLAKQGTVDAKRACIVGASYGGYVALAGVTVQQGLYRCAVSVAGVEFTSGHLAIISGGLWLTHSPGWQEFYQPVQYPPNVYSASFVAGSNVAIVAKYGHDEADRDYDASKSYVQALLNTENQATLAQWCGKLPGGIRAIERRIDQARDRRTREALKAFEQALYITVDRSMPNVPNFVQIEEKLKDTFADIWDTVGDMKRQSTELAIDEVIENCDRMIGQKLASARRTIESFSSGRTTHFSRQEFEDLELRPPGHFDLLIRVTSSSMRIHEVNGEVWAKNEKGVTQELEISPIPLRILFKLALSPERVCSRADLLRDIYQYEYKIGRQTLSALLETAKGLNDIVKGLHANEVVDVRVINELNDQIRGLLADLNKAEHDQMLERLRKQVDFLQRSLNGWFNRKVVHRGRNDLRLDHNLTIGVVFP